MKGRWSFGVIVAIVAAIAVATAGQSRPQTARHAAQPIQVTLALEPDGASLRISHDAVAVTFEF